MLRACSCFRRLFAAVCLRQTRTPVTNKDERIAVANKNLFVLARIFNPRSARLWLRFNEVSQVGFFLTSVSAPTNSVRVSASSRGGPNSR